MTDKSGRDFAAQSDRTPKPGQGSRAIGLACLVFAAMVNGCAGAGRGVSRETVWEGEVVVRESFVVPPGERLLIRPGTRVLFAFWDPDGDGSGDAGIVVRGGIEARGTGRAPVEFVPETAVAPGRAGWSEVLIEDAETAIFVHCRFTGAQQAIHAHRTPLEVESSRFERNGFALRFTGDPVAVRGNRFVGNGTALRYWGSSPEVTANAFEGNGTAIFVREESARSLLTRNSFLSSADYHVKLGELQSADVQARENWWGSVRPEEIEALIYDRQDVGYLGRVLYAPPATGPLPTATPAGD